MPNKLKIFVGFVILAGVFTLFLEGVPLSTTELVGVLFFALMGLAFEHLSIEVPGTQFTVSVSFVPILTCLLLFGAPTSTWVAAISSLNWREITGGKPMYRNLFNLCQMALAASLAAFLYSSFGGILGSPLITRPGPIVAAILAYMLVNAALPTIAYALATNVSMYTIFLRHVSWSVPGFLATAPLGVLAALVFSTSGYIGVLLFVLPLVFARMAFKLYLNMRRNYMETMQSLAQAIDAKDHYTRGHSERVAFYSVEIARRLGWNQAGLDTLQYLALLHDVGKIGVKEHVLNKQGRLTDEERQDVHRHSDLGANIVENISFLREQAGYVRYHHERYGGGGYPGGLVAEDIPLGARIIAVADAFDAMTSARVYQPARSAALAIEELQKCKGTQFDPRVVDAFVNFAADIDVLAVANRGVGGESHLATPAT